jgi:tRNAThr (cytosine32-N3)-methyltransferase
VTGTYVTPPKIFLTWSWSSLTTSFAADELALLFTGSPAPPTAHEHAQLQQQAHESASESTEVEVDEENASDEDERFPDGRLLASSALAIPPSLDSDSSSSAAAPSGPLPGSTPDSSPHVIHPSLQGGPDILGLAHPLFTITQLGVDRRLLVNRKRQLKMYRVWMQGKFQRTEADGTPLVVELNAGTS